MSQLSEQLQLSQTTYLDLKIYILMMFFKRLFIWRKKKKAIFSAAAEFSTHLQEVLASAPKVGNG